LDPDTFKQLEKFRRVQGHVRSSKAKFDRHKLACLQKVDLLAAARCNMFSHGLIVYQENLAGFWQRTSKAMQTVSEAYKGIINSTGVSENRGKNHF
jgi:DNA-binding FrmR family transcriptional regulator